jgi:3-phenylpropionate/cinnamic acid dioxygenase small subunit
MSRPDPADARTEIENLLYRYAEQIDAGDFAGLGDLLSRARIFSPNGDVIATGNAEIKAMYDRSTRVYEDGSPMTRHLTTNVMIDFDGDGRTAETRSRFTVMQALPDFPLQCIITGDYEDRFAHEASAGWYFTERTMKPRLLGDLSRHLNFDLSGA